MIICSASNIDLVQGQGTVGYGNADGTTDWRITNTPSATVGQTGTFNIFNSVTPTIPNISILETGTVGIGTVPSFSSAAKMEIIGDVNITGAYNINNRNAINDTSNYVLATSNILINRINASSGGGAITSGGNLTLTNNATSNTILSISNSNVVVGSSNYTSNYSSNVVTASSFTASFVDNVVPNTHEQVTGSTDRYMVFTNTSNIGHTFTVPTGGLVCDILMIGGGGCGASGTGAGAGACIVALNQTLPAGFCVVRVGAGGATNGVNGTDSSITAGGTIRYLAKGGGAAGLNNTVGFNGGCGGGGGYRDTTGTASVNGGIAVSANVVNGSLANIEPSITSNYAVMGNPGGNNGTAIYIAGSGGGIGTVGGNAGGNGGNGAYQITLSGSSTPINFRSYFANNGTAYGFGIPDGTTGNFYIGGGGGSYNNNNSPSTSSGGLGGGSGINTNYVSVQNTGSGGHGNGGIGGSGIIIIRYRTVATINTIVGTVATTPIPILGTSSVELVRGTQGDSNTNYKIGNYKGDFQIMSSISNTDTSRLAISSSGNMIINNNSTNTTALSIINSNIDYGYESSSYTSNIVTETSATAATAISPSGGTFTIGQITSSIDKFCIFTAGSSTFTVPTGGLNCDILMIGGGGGGGWQDGGGGAGACIVAINQTLPAGSCVVSVGTGGTGGSPSTNGGDSSISVGGNTRYLAKGGGAGQHQSKGNDGGSGGGGGMNTTAGGTIKAGGAPVITNIVVLSSGLTSNIGPCLSSTFAVFGNKGGTQYDSSGIVNSQWTAGANTSAGGGGIGTAGGDHADGANENGSPGGDGLYQVTINSQPYNFRNWFANGSTTFGVQDGSTTNYYIGGGGGGHGSNGTDATTGRGGLGGGGRAAVGGVGSSSGITNTGSGGGGFNNANYTTNGGSGIVIIRYRIGGITNTSITITTPGKPVTFGTPSIELVRGTQGDSNTDYKIGNYNGDFKVMSSIFNTDTDRFIVNSSGNVGIGTTNPVNELHLFDSMTSNTALTIQNNNISDVVTTPVITPTNTSGGVFSVGQITTTANSTDRFMIFTAGTSAFTVPTGGIVCDILMIGGGGKANLGGGGAGACIIALNQTLIAGSCSVVVGTGGTSSNGGDSSITVAGSTQYLAKGGGTGTGSGLSGGCGGGGDQAPGFKSGGIAVSTNTVNGTTNIGPGIRATFAVLGTKGGDNGGINNYSGGGGGISTIGVTGGKGGDGAYQVTLTGSSTPINFRTYFANNGTFGVQDGTTGNYYIGGGGGGTTNGGSTYGIGGLGGGGVGNVASVGITNTGSGGAQGGNGGSGIVIIRYRSSTATLGSPSIELVRGTSGDSNTDYKIGNYGGNFKVMSSVNNSDTDRLIINSAGNVGIGITNPTSTLHVNGTINGTFVGNGSGLTNLPVISSQWNGTGNIYYTGGTVSIGTTNASYTLNVGGSISTYGNAIYTGSLNANSMDGGQIYGRTIQLDSYGAETLLDIVNTSSSSAFLSGGPDYSGQITNVTSTDRYMIFRTEETSNIFIIPSGGLACDILMIGGGGNAGTNCGGGAGACIVARDRVLPEGTCLIMAGRGGWWNNGTGGQGQDSVIYVNGVTRWRAKGGGRGGTVNDTAVLGRGYDGGCGGGGSHYSSGGAYVGGGSYVTTNVIEGSSGYGNGNSGPYATWGNAGGDNGSSYSNSGGGGGIGAPGSMGYGGYGRYFTNLNGTDYNFRDWFGNGIVIGSYHTDNKYYIGGGGNGVVAGAWQSGTGRLGNGWGNGGGGDGDPGNGFVAIRYRGTAAAIEALSPSIGTPIIRLKRGNDDNDSNRDYKIGNYRGNFIVKSSVSGVDTDYLKILGTDGTIYNKPNSSYWNTTSDRRVKENIVRASYDKCYENIDKLELNRFNYIKEFNDGNKDSIQLGFIAQEIKDIFPKAVYENHYNTSTLTVDNLLSIDVSQINYTLYGAVKKLMEINKDKESRLKRLECLLNIESGSSESSNLPIDTSNLPIDTSNLPIDTSNQQIYTSNLPIDTSNLPIDTSNLPINTSNLPIDTSNLPIDTSNLPIDTSNLPIDTSNLPIDTSNLPIDTSNLPI